MVRVGELSVIDALLEALGAAWDFVLERLWRADHGGKSLEGEPRPDSDEKPKDAAA